jgi:hypothetical protein
MVRAASKWTASPSVTSIIFSSRSRCTQKPRAKNRTNGSWNGGIFGRHSYSSPSRTLIPNRSNCGRSSLNLPRRSKKIPPFSKKPFQPLRAQPEIQASREGQHGPKNVSNAYSIFARASKIKTQQPSAHRRYQSGIGEAQGNRRAIENRTRKGSTPKRVLEKLRSERLLGFFKMKDVKEFRFDSLYKLIVTAQRSRDHGGHYKCTFQSAALMLQVLLGERPDLERDPYFQRQHGFSPDWGPRENIVLVPRGFLWIKTPSGWKSGIRARLDERKLNQDGSTR